jgi:replicative DNA helicase
VQDSHVQDKRIESGKEREIMHTMHIDMLAELNEQRYADLVREAAVLRQLRAAREDAPCYTEAAPTMPAPAMSTWPMRIRAAFSR